MFSVATVVKLFSFINDLPDQISYSVCPWQAFLASLIFAGKARAL
jgi:hypothetical protein